MSDTTKRTGGGAAIGALGGAILGGNREGAAIGAGIDHPAYPIEITSIAEEIRDSLAGDLQPSAIN